MSWLCLDTHVSGRSLVGLLGSSGWIEFREIEGRGHRVLAVLADLHTRYTQDIQGVAVVPGPGSFSAIRTGVLYANLYARLRHLPLKTILVGEWSDPVHLYQELEGGERAVSAYVAPIYDQEPNITIPKPSP